MLIMCIIFIIAIFFKFLDHCIVYLLREQKVMISSQNQNFVWIIW